MKLPIRAPRGRAGQVLPLVVLLVCCGRLSAVPLGPGAPRTVNVDRDAREQAIHMYCEVLEDPGGRLGLEEITRLDTPFQVLNREALHFGFTASVYWIRFVYRTAGDTPPITLGLYNYRLADVRVWVRAGARELARYHTGAEIPLYSRVIPARELAVPLPPAPETATVYLRVRSDSPLRFHPHIIREDVRARRDVTEAWLAGLFFGAQLIMALYNLFLYASLRDRSYLYYALYVVLFVLVQMNIANFLAWTVLADYPALDRALQPVLGFLLLSALAVFTREFLNLRRVAARASLALRLIALLGVIGALAATVLPLRLAQQLTVAFLILAPLAPTAAAALALRRGYRPARFFLIAFALTLAYITFFGITRLFAVYATSTVFHFLVHDAMPIVLLSEITLLSFALGDRYAILRQEKEAERARHETQLRDERERINRELHDVIGSDLSLMLLEGARRQDATEIEKRQQERLARTLTRLRDLVHMNQVPADLPARLADDMRAHVREAADAGGLIARVELGAVRLELRQAFHTQRFFLEAVTNVLRHADARTLRVRLRQTRRGRVTLLIADDGRGLPVPRVTGAGLGNLVDRATFLRGRFRLFSQPDHGTVVALCFHARA